MAIVNLVEKGITARDIINEKSIGNALACDMALGCSSNSVLHLLAIATEAGVDMDLSMFNEFSAKVPNLCHLAPAGDAHMQDLFVAGGLQAVLNELDKKGLVDRSLITANGKTVGGKHRREDGAELRDHSAHRQSLQRNGRHCHSLGEYRKRWVRGEEECSGSFHVGPQWTGQSF